jgi:hypothetical protein
MRNLRKAVDDRFDRLMRGEAPSADESWAFFVQRVKRIAEAPPDPSVEQRHLSAILQEAHLLVEKGDPVGRPVSNAAGPASQASALPKRRRRLVLNSLFASLASKLAAGGVAVALASTGGLAATGNLPDDVQDKVSEVADNLGLDIPAGDELDDATDDLDGDDDGEIANADAGKRSNFDVHEAQATNTGTARGQAISEAARQKPEGETTGNDVSAAVHEAINNTPPGPERGKAVSEAAHQAHQNGGTDDTGTDDIDSDDTDSDDSGDDSGGRTGSHGQGQSKKNKP